MFSSKGINPSREVGDDQKNIKYISMEKTEKFCHGS